MSIIKGLASTARRFGLAGLSAALLVSPLSMPVQAMDASGQTGETVRLSLYRSERGKIEIENLSTGVSQADPNPSVTQLPKDEEGNDISVMELTMPMDDETILELRRKGSISDEALEAAEKWEQEHPSTVSEEKGDSVITRESLKKVSLNRSARAEAAKTAKEKKELEEKSQKAREAGKRTLEEVYQPRQNEIVHHFEAAAGDRIRITATAQEGYRLNRFLKNGEDVSSVKTGKDTAVYEFTATESADYAAAFVREDQSDDPYLFLAWDSIDGPVFKPTDEKRYEAMMEEIYGALDDQEKNRTKAAALGRVYTDYDRNSGLAVNIINNKGQVLASFGNCFIYAYHNGSASQIFCQDPFKTWQNGDKWYYKASEYHSPDTAKMMAVAVAVSRYSGRQDLLPGTQAFASIQNDRQKLYVMTQINVWRVLFGADVGGTRIAPHILSYDQQDAFIIAVENLVWRWQEFDFSAPEGVYETYRVYHEGNSQPGFWTPFVGFKKKGSLAIEKTSSLPDLSGSNENYSLEGAVYGLYEEKSTDKKVGEFTLDAAGKSNTIQNLKPDHTYYIREIRAPAGYAISTDWVAARVSAGQTSTIRVSDAPQRAEVEALIQKNGPENTPLADAHFELRYFTHTQNDQSDPEAAGHAPARVWVMRSDQNGRIGLEENQKVSGDAFYRDESGKAVLPLGTLSIREIKAPAGYVPSDDLVVLSISPSGSGKTVHTFAAEKAAVVVNQYEEYELYLQKQQAFSPNLHEVIFVPGTTFTLTRPDGTTEEVITDEHGSALLSRLRPGKYRLQETSVPEGYELNETEVTFEVIAGKGVQNVKQADSSAIEYQDEASRIVFRNEVSPYSVQILKTNEQKNRLAGARFKLATDRTMSQNVQTLETDENGILNFAGLQNGVNYYLQEVKAPEGYRIPVDEKGNAPIYELQVQFVPVRNDWTVTVNQKTYAFEEDSDGFVQLSGPASAKVVQLNILNHMMAVLPETGSSATIWWVAGGLVFFLAGVVLVLSGRRWSR